MDNRRLRPMARTGRRTGISAAAGSYVIHIVKVPGTGVSLCGRAMNEWSGGDDYADCRSCLKIAHVPLPQPITQEEFDALARELGIDMHHWHASIQEECFDNDGMPIVDYPHLADGTFSYEILLDALARVV